METARTKPRLCVKVEEMAEMIGVSRAVGYELARRSDFPTIRSGRRILVPVAGLEKWLEAQAGGYQKNQGVS